MGIKQKKEQELDNCWFGGKGGVFPNILKCINKYKVLLEFDENLPHTKFQLMFNFILVQFH